MTFAVYTRKSVQTGKGDSVENQLQLCKNYILAKYPKARQEDITVFEDEGFSGKNINRPRFSQMLAEIDSGRFDALVCYQLDRVSRSVSDFSFLIERLNRGGVHFISVKEEFDTQKPMGKAMLYIASVFAQLERETTAQRVRDNMLFLSRAGRWLGGTAPTGFFVEKKTDTRGEKTQTYPVLRTNPAEKEIVLAIFKAFFASENIYATVRQLAEAGVLSRNGQPFIYAGIKEILKNPVYCAADEAARAYFAEKGAVLCFVAADCTDSYGLAVYNKTSGQGGKTRRLPVAEWVVAAGRHEAFLSGEEWTLAQQVLQKGASKKEPAPHNRYALLSGVLYCKSCGAKMQAKHRSGRDGFDYICQNKLVAGKKGCAGQNLHGPTADRLVWQALADYREVGSQAAQIFLKKRQAALQKSEDPGQKDDRARQELAKITARLAAGEATPGLIATLEENIARMKQDAAHPPEKDTGKQEEIDRLARKLTDPALYEGIIPSQYKRRFVKEVAGRIYWDGQTLEVNLADG